MYNGAGVIETDCGDNFDESDHHNEVLCEIENEESGRNAAVAIIQGVYFEGINIENDWSKRGLK
jgi:hypothetical protein